MYPPMRRLSSVSSDDFVENNPCAALGAWFLGPNGENGDIFQDLLTRAVESHVKFRQRYVIARFQEIFKSHGRGLWKG